MFLPKCAPMIVQPILDGVVAIGESASNSMPHSYVDAGYRKLPETWKGVVWLRGCPKELRGGNERASN